VEDGSGETFGAIRAELRSHDARLDSNHHAIGDLRAKQAAHDAEIRVTGVELRETRADIAELKADVAGRFTHLETKLETELGAMRRAAKWVVWLAISIFTLVLMAAGIAVAFIH
jgi:hypothetical protein